MVKIKINRDEVEDAHSRKKIDKWILIFLLLVIGLIPLLVGGYLKEVISPLIEDRELLQSGYKIDVFTHYKFIGLVSITTIVLSLFLYKLYFLDYKIPSNTILYFFTIFIISIVFSVVFSPTKTIALYGQFNRSDGALSYICYIVLMFISMNITYPKKIIHYILYSLIPLTLINFILITMNFSGKDALQFDVLRNSISIFLPVDVTLSESSTILGTLNHFNYMSGMFSILTVLFLSCTLIVKSNFKKIFYLLISLISFAIVLMALSKSGFLTIICFIPILVWFILKSKQRIFSFISFVLFISIGGVLIHVFSLENSEVWDESIGIIIPNNPYKIKKEVAISSKVTWDMFDIKDNKAYAADKQFELPIIPESGVGTGSGRVFIWERTLELTMKRPLFGYGLDTLMYNFPHNDIELRANLETETVVVDKPHNLFIGVLYGTGIIGFIGFLGIIAVICWHSLKHIISFNSKNGELLVLLGVAWIAYIFQSLFNDSLPGITAPFWIIGGIILGSSYNIRDKMNIS